MNTRDLKPDEIFVTFEYQLNNNNANTYICNINEKIETILRKFAAKLGIDYSLNVIILLK